MEKNYALKFMVTFFLVTIILASVIFPKVPVYSQTNKCGPMDLTIALDDTGSMGGAIDNIKSELPNIINDAKVASDGDLRLGYITFKDDVTVHYSLTTNLPAVEASIMATTASGGSGAPEASDEAKNTAVNNLGPRLGQNGDFSIPWRANPTVKILVLITDAPPGGFNDIKDPDDVARMHDVALTAKSQNILISDIFVPTDGDYDGQLAILKDDADTSGGIFNMTTPDGIGTSDAIKKIIENCGTPTSGNICPATNIQHWDKIIFEIKDRRLAEKLNLPEDSELDIKVIDDPTKVADIKKKVLDFLKMPDDKPLIINKTEDIKIIDVEYAIICAASNPPIPEPTTIDHKMLELSKPPMADTDSFMAKIRESQLSTNSPSSLVNQNQTITQNIPR
jgi:hypothetical protein